MNANIWLSKFRSFNRLQRWLNIKTGLTNNNSGSGQQSYSQSGEDIIIDYIFKSLDISYPTYLDIGAHDPIYLSNTYLFYKRGCIGVCVEPDPYLAKRIKKKRKRDTCVNVGVGFDGRRYAEFYIMTYRTLNTFSKEEAESYEQRTDVKISIEHTLSLPMVTINELVERHFGDCPSFISIDIEGLDLKVLQTFDFKRFRPQVFCIETIRHDGAHKYAKDIHVVDLLTSNGYFLYADTFINSIFISTESFSRLRIC